MNHAGRFGKTKRSVMKSDVSPKTHEPTTSSPQTASPRSATLIACRQRSAAAAVRTLARTGITCPRTPPPPTSARP